MVDVARLGLAVDSSQVEKGTVSLHQLTGAAGQASVAAQKLAGASQAEAAGQKTATVAVQAHNAALMAQNTVMRSSMHQRTMMIYQLNDVAVSLASGMNPAMVAMQQGSQILQGGLMPAIRTLVDLGKSLVVTFWPVAAVIGAVSAGVAGLAYEINKTADVQVGFFDVALAGWQLLAEQVAAWVAPVFGAIGSWLQHGWDAAAPILKDIGNAIIGTFVGSFEAVKATWGALPSAIGDFAYQAADNLFFSVQIMIRNVQVEINKFLAGIDRALLAANMPTLGLNVGAINPQRMDNPFAGQGAAAAGAASGAFAGAQQDYLGSAFGALSQRAQDIAAARQEMDALGGSTKAANDNAKALNDTSKSLADTWGNTLKSAWSGFWSEFKSGLQEGKGFWESLGNAGASALDKIASKALDMAANGIFDMIFGSIMGGITGGLGGNSLGGGWGVAGGFGGRGIFGIPGMADGGTVGRAGLSWVGEQGPELLRLPQGAQVIPNGPSMAMAANNNGGTSVVRIELGPDLEGRILAQSAGNAVQIVQASEPGTVQKSTAASGKALAGGDYRRGMASYGLQQQAKRR